MYMLKSASILSYVRQHFLRSDCANVPILSVRCLRMVVYWSAMLSVLTGGLIAVNPLRGAEPFIGRHVADMFVFSVLRNNPERLVPHLAPSPTAASIQVGRRAER